MSDINSSVDRINYLVDSLNKAAKAYYQEGSEIMSNIEYDRRYDELQELERSTGIILSNSPTQHVGYEVVSELVKVRHTSPMLSLDKTKDINVLMDWLGNKKGILSWKLDGITMVLTYNNGLLDKAVTRGNGDEGEIVTSNARTFINLPLHIPYRGELIVRGEAIITYSDFAMINDIIEDVDSKYKNPRNLCSGSVRQLNSEITASRSIRFVAFNLVRGLEEHMESDTYNSYSDRLEELRKLGLEIVEYKKVTNNNLAESVKDYQNRILNNDMPSDGLVLQHDDIAYGDSLGRTAKFPRNAIAFKWADDMQETTLIDVEWNASRTGLINPIAIFKPVELEGTTVNRASLHNVSIVKNLRLGLNDRILVYKANMIIPQIDSNLTRSDNLIIPTKCPACGENTSIIDSGEVITLNCYNALCPAKKIKAFTHYTSRDSMNIEGLSESTLEKLISGGLLHSFADIYILNNYESLICNMDGLGKKSYDNMIESINNSKCSTLDRLINALGITNVGRNTAKLICKYYNYDASRAINAQYEEISRIDGIGPVIAKNYTDYMMDACNKDIIYNLLEHLELKIPKHSMSNRILEGKSYVITGSLEHYSNRDELKSAIEASGGKVTGSVTSKTTALINNDIESNSSKNKKAKDLGVSIITESEIMNILSEGVI